MKTSKFFLWRHLSRKDIGFLARVVSKQQQGQFLASRLFPERFAEGSSKEQDLRRRSLTELFVNALSFANRQSMNAAKVSTLLSIVLDLHDSACSAPMGTPVAAFKRFQANLIRHSVERPPFSIGVFSVGDVRAVVDYMVGSYFRHFKMYQFVFGEKPKLEVTDGPASVDPAADGASAEPEPEPEIVPLGGEEELDEKQDKAADDDAAGGDGITPLSQEEEKKIQNLSKEEQEEFYSLFKEHNAKMQEAFQKQVSEQQDKFTQKLEGLFASMKSSS